ncbi:hypothetical protein EVAR_52743_1 [Eumeta japonica]|uniref:Uncharacterized protein n=1 Tax=Eumeta variegata TaxID=151549 RepID=A0A4C1Y6H8_EUMVA|nr:hypothetical protein EVAR_52743_1 [Eumeta japonica]
MYIEAARGTIYKEMFHEEAATVLCTHVEAKENTRLRHGRTSCEYPVTISRLNTRNDIDFVRDCDQSVLSCLKINIECVSMTTRQRAALRLPLDEGTNDNYAVHTADRCERAAYPPPYNNACITGRFKLEFSLGR